LNQKLDESRLSSEENLFLSEIEPPVIVHVTTSLTELSRLISVYCIRAKRSCSDGTSTAVLAAQKAARTDVSDIAMLLTLLMSVSSPAKLPFVIKLYCTIQSV
jgi:hypothetical protein